MVNDGTYTYTPHAPYTMEQAAASYNTFWDYQSIQVFTLNHKASDIYLHNDIKAKWEHALYILLVTPLPVSKVPLVDNVAVYTPLQETH